MGLSDFDSPDTDIEMVLLTAETATVDTEPLVAILASQENPEVTDVQWTMGDGGHSRSSLGDRRGLIEKVDRAGYEVPWLVVMMESRMITYQKLDQSGMCERHFLSGGIWTNQALQIDPFFGPLTRNENNALGEK